MSDIFQFMKTKPPVLLPLFRSQSQARLLAHLYLHAPGGGVPLSALAKETGVSPGTAHREVGRLEEAGLVRSARRGRERRVRANEESPYYAELRALLLKAFGPVAVLRALLEGIAGIERAYVFGSWARRYGGEPGEAPADLDLLVIGHPAPDDVYSACRRAEGELGIAVDPVILTEREWEDRAGGLIRHVRSGPTVPIVPAA